MSLVEVIIPFSGRDPDRLLALDYISERMPYPMTVSMLHDNAWVKALAVWPAVKRSEADIIVIHDADVWAQDGLQEAVQAVADGHPWSQPHEMVHRLSEGGTQNVLAGASWSNQTLSQPAYRASTRCGAGGIMIARRETLLDIILDPRFIGWGQEDVSHDMALTTLAGSPWRGRSKLVHLWHTPQARMSRKAGSQASWDLYSRYCAALNKRDRMLSLIAEAHDALGSALHTD